MTNAEKIEKGLLESLAIAKGEGTPERITTIRVSTVPGKPKGERVDA